MSGTDTASNLSNVHIDDVTRRVLDLLRELGDEPDDGIRASSSLIDDLGLDSLDVAELAMALEDEFNLAIPDSDLIDNANTTVGDVIAYIVKRLSEAKES